MRSEPYTESYLISRYGQPIFRHRFDPDYPMEGKGLWNNMPSECMVFRHRDNANGGLVLYANFDCHDDWSPNDNQAKNFFIREVLNGRIKIDNPMNEPWPEFEPKES